MKNTVKTGNFSDVLNSMKDFIKDADVAIVSLNEEKVLSKADLLSNSIVNSLERNTKPSKKTLKL